MKLRAIFVAFFAILLAGEVAAAPIPLWVRRVSNAAPPPTVPVLGVGSWTGTPQAAPSDPIRTTAKPTLLWQKPSDVRLVTNRRLCVDADAPNGGVSTVEIGHGATSVNAAYILNTYVNQRTGALNSVPGWCADVDAAAFRAVSTTGSENFWARATAVDGTMQQRVIGGPRTQSGYDTYAFGGNYIMTMYPRTTENDNSVTVCGSGGATYTTIKSAFDALRVGTDEAPLITITCSGNYIIANASGTERTSGQRAVLTVANGVTATLGQAGITYNNSTTFDVTLGWDGIEFRGNPLGSLVFDTQWLRFLKFSSQPGWLNGVVFTSSVGTSQSLYWNGDRPPPVAISSPLAGYIDDTSSTYSAGQGVNNRYAMNSVWMSVYGDIFTAAPYVYGNQIVGYDNSFTQNGGGSNNTTGFNISYSGVGGGVKSLTVYAPGMGSAVAYNTLVTESGANTSVVGTIFNTCCQSLDGFAITSGQIPNSSYTGSAAIYFAGQPSPGDTITTGTLSGGVSTNTHVWTWVTGAPVGFQIQIGATVALSVANAAAKLTTDNNFGSAIVGSARFSKPNDINNTGFLNLYVDGDLIQAVPMGVYSSDTNPTIAAMATAVTSSGWTASPANSYNLFRAASLNGIGTFTDYDALNRTHPMTVGYDPHAEMHHTYSAGATRQNITWRNNRALNYNNAPFINNDATLSYDYTWKGNVWLGANNNPIVIDGNSVTNLVVQYNTYAGTFNRFSLQVGDHTYSKVTNNIIAGGGYPSGATPPNCYPNSPAWNNNVLYPPIVSGSPCAVNGPIDSGNVDPGATSFSSLFVDVTTGDVRPAVAGYLLSHQFPSVSTYDGRALPFAATDVAGAWSKNDPAP